MTATDCPRSFSKAPRSYPQWHSQTLYIFNKPRTTCGLQTMFSNMRGNRRSFISYSRRSFNNLTLFLLITFILFIGGVLARPAETTISRFTKTTAYPSSLPTHVDQDQEDQSGGDSQGSDSQSWPRPFDTSIGRNFSSTTCPQFFNVFLGDPEFQDCLPISAMLKNSKSFFDVIKKSGFQTTLLLNAACSVDFAKCTSKMDYYARQIMLSQNCGQELSQGNPLVSEAYAALLAYPSVHSATCLKAKDGSYCYVNAITNVTNPDDSHLYYLPLGFQLPGGSRPACSKCARETMTGYAKFAGNKTLPLSRTYVPAAEQINIICGSQFTNATILISSSGTRGYNFPPLGIVMATIVSTLFLV